MEAGDGWCSWPPSWSTSSSPAPSSPSGYCSSNSSTYLTRHRRQLHGYRRFVTSCTVRWVRNAPMPSSISRSLVHEFLLFTRSLPGRILSRAPSLPPPVPVSRLCNLRLNIQVCLGLFTAPYQTVKTPSRVFTSVRLRFRDYLCDEKNSMELLANVNFHVTSRCIRGPCCYMLKGKKQEDEFVR